MEKHRVGATGEYTEYSWGGAELQDFSCSKSSDIMSSGAAFEIFFDSTLVKKKHQVQQKANWEICLGSSASAVVSNVETVAPLPPDLHCAML